MRARAYLYGLLIVFVAIQATIVKNMVWMPDGMLILIIFTGIFFGRTEGGLIGFVGGFLRGCFSVDTLVVDVFIFSMIGVMSSVLAKKFYRQNPVAQIFTTMISLLVVISVHTFYLNAASGNDIGIVTVLTNSWKNILVTVLSAPVIFVILKEILLLEE